MEVLICVWVCCANIHESELYWTFSGRRLRPSVDILHDIQTHNVHKHTLTTLGGFPSSLKYIYTGHSERHVSLWWKNVNVSFTPVLSFIMIKQLILWERGKRETQASSVIHRLSCFIHKLVILYHAPLNSPSGEGTSPLKQISHIPLFWFLPPFPPISLFILHMWLPSLLRSY